jgi:hypothetical protein
MAIGDPELEEYFEDFILGLTFPQLFTVNGKSTRWRQAQTVLSATWQCIKLAKSKCALA